MIFNIKMYKKDTLKEITYYKQIYQVEYGLNNDEISLWMIFFGNEFNE